MKINILNSKKYKLFKLNLFKNQVYSSIESILSTDSRNKKNTTSLDVSLKKVFKVIFSYHIFNKKILFVGLPEFKHEKYERILKSTQHFFIPNLSWINGFLFNRKFILKNLKVKYLNKNTISYNYLKFFLLFKTKPDLIVVFNPEKEIELIKEFKKLKIPIISIDTSDNLSKKLKNKNLYNITGNFKFVSKNSKNFFILLLSSIFKRNLKQSNYYSHKYFVKNKIHPFKQKIHSFRIKKSRFSFKTKQSKQNFKIKSNKFPKR